jgi:hypothetical protein
MKQITGFIYVLLSCILYPQIVYGQVTFPATGGTATGSGGKATYTVGQLVFNEFTGTTGSVIGGVQQPYEISVVTAIESTNGIILQCIIYPNPTSGFIRLVIKSIENDSMRFRLFDINGVLLQDKEIESEETEISLESFSSSVYFLKVIKDNLEVKVFKIIKK